MSRIEIGAAQASDLVDLAEIGEQAQADPERFVAYFAVEASAIEAEIAEFEDWAAATCVARRSGRAVGWLLAETDEELGRVWWWGPTVATGVPWDGVADALYAAGRARLGERYDQEELAADDRSTSFPAFAGRHGFRAEGASSIFRMDIGRTSPDGRVVPLAPTDRDLVATLHDALFAGTHTTGRQLVDADDGFRLVVRHAGRAVGYVAVEVQADGEGYVDYLGVHPDHRGGGIGEALVSTALDTLRQRGSTAVNLTVRVDTSAPARRLYHRLGFDEVRVARPFRKGFTLP